MPFSMIPGKGWPKGHPFFLLLLLGACSVSPTPPAVAPVPPCGAATAAASPRLDFTAVPSGLPRSGQWRDHFDLADMNGDGDLDVVHGPAREGAARPAIFLGDGLGGFIPWRTARYPPLPYDYGDAKAADFDGNGLMDFALASHLRGLTVLVQEAEGHFAPWAAGLEFRLPAGDQELPFTSRAIAVSDWNGDRLPDLLALNEGPTMHAPRPQADALALFLNRGGEWQRSGAGIPPGGIFGRAIATGDVNGDRKPDAVLGTSVAGNRSLVLLGDGVSWRVRDLGSLPDQATVSAVALHDFDGDRRQSMVAGIAWHEGDATCIGVDVIDLTNEGDEATPLFRDASNDPFVAVVPADFDGDRRTDVLAVRMHGSMTVFRGGPEGFVRDTDVPAPASMAGCDAWDAHAADLDRDGTPEVIVSFAGELAADLGPPCTSGGGFVTWRVGARR